MLHGTHIVETVRQLDQDHADILGHCQEHLTHVLGLLLFLGGIRDLTEFRDTVHQLGDIGTEHFFDQRDRNFRIFHGIVQERRHQRIGIDFQFRQDLGGRDRMDNIRLSGLSLLGTVRFIGENEGAPDAVRFGFLRIVVGLVASDDLVEHVQDVISDPLRESGVAQLGKNFGLRDFFSFLVVACSHLLTFSLGSIKHLIRLCILKFNLVMHR